MQDFNVLGVRWRLTGKHELYSHICEDYARYKVARQKQQDIHVVCEDTPLSIQGKRIVRYKDYVLYKKHNLNILAYDDGSVVHVNPTRLHIFSPYSDRALELCYTHFESILCIALQKKGFLPVHAAGIVHKEKVYLLQFPTGIGKSTLAYQASKHNTPILADDIVLFKNGFFHGLQTPVRLREKPREATKKVHDKYALKNALFSLKPVAEACFLFHTRSTSVRRVSFLRKAWLLFTSTFLGLQLHQSFATYVPLRFMDFKRLACLGVFRLRAYIQLLQYSAYALPIHTNPQKTWSVLFAFMSTSQQSKK